MWRPLSEAFLAPEGKPLEGRDGDIQILEALQVSAAEFSTGFGFCVDKDAWDSDWIRDNKVIVMLRRAHWLTRMMILSRMLNLPVAEWVIGVIRRMNATDASLELGISVVTRKPTLLWCENNDTGHSGVWDDEKRFEKNFDEHFTRGILVEPQGHIPAAGEILFPPGTASRGSWFDMPVKGGMARIMITRVREETQDFQRVEFEPHAF